MNPGGGGNRALPPGELARLPWRRLAELSTDLGLPPRLRVLACRHLAQRVERLSLGERISLARIASRELFHPLAELQEPKVVGALLGNPRWTFQDTLELCADPDTPGEILRRVAEGRRRDGWVKIRQALTTHPKTPVHLALTLLLEMNESELRDLLKEKSLPRLVEIEIVRRLGG